MKRKSKDTNHFDNVVFDDRLIIYDKDGEFLAIQFSNSDNNEEMCDYKFSFDHSNPTFTLDESHKLIEFFTACIEKIASVHIEHRSKK